MNSADCAMMPGDRKARYDTDPVLITCKRLNVVPKINNHSAGCTIRVTSSVRSCCSFCSSTIAKAPMRLSVAPIRCQPRGARTRVTSMQCWSTDTAGNLSAGTNFTEVGRFGGLLGQGRVRVRGRVVAEHVLERGAG